MAYQGICCMVYRLEAEPTKCLNYTTPKKFDDKLPLPQMNNYLSSLKIHYPFLEPRQLMAKVYDKFGIPHVCGEISQKNFKIIDSVLESDLFYGEECKKKKVPLKPFTIKKEKIFPKLNIKIKKTPQLKSEVKVEECDIALQISNTPVCSKATVIKSIMKKKKKKDKCMALRSKKSVRFSEDVTSKVLEEKSEYKEEIAPLKVPKLQPPKLSFEDSLILGRCDSSDESDFYEPITHSGFSSEEQSDGEQGPSRVYIPLEEIQVSCKSPCKTEIIESPEEHNHNEACTGPEVSTALFDPEFDPWELIAYPEGGEVFTIIDNFDGISEGISNAFITIHTNQKYIEEIPDKFEEISTPGNEISSLETDTSCKSGQIVENTQSSIIEMRRPQLPSPYDKGDWMMLTVAANSPSIIKKIPKLLTSFNRSSELEPIIGNFLEHSLRQTSSLMDGSQHLSMAFSETAVVEESLISTQNTFTAQNATQNGVSSISNSTKINADPKVIDPFTKVRNWRNKYVPGRYEDFTSQELEDVVLFSQEIPGQKRSDNTPKDSDTSWGRSSVIRPVPIEKLQQNSSSARQDSMSHDERASEALCRNPDTHEEEPSPSIIKVNNDSMRNESTTHESRWYNSPSERPSGSDQPTASPSPGVSNHFPFTIKTEVLSNSEVNVIVTEETQDCKPYIVRELYSSSNDGSSEDDSSPKRSLAKTKKLRKRKRLDRSDNSSDNSEVKPLWGRKHKRALKSTSLRKKNTPYRHSQNDYFASNEVSDMNSLDLKISKSRARVIERRIRNSLGNGLSWHKECNFSSQQSQFDHILTTPPQSPNVNANLHILENSPQDVSQISSRYGEDHRFITNRTSQQNMDISPKCLSPILASSPSSLDYEELGEAISKCLMKGEK